MRDSVGRQSAIEQHEVPVPGTFRPRNHSARRGAASCGGAARPGRARTRKPATRARWDMLSHLSCRSPRPALSCTLPRLRAITLDGGQKPRSPTKIAAKMSETAEPLLDVRGVTLQYRTAER